MSDPAGVRHADLRTSARPEWAAIEGGEARRSARGTAGGDAPAGAAAESTLRLRRLDRPILGAIDAAGSMVQRNVWLLVLGSAVIILPSVAVNLLFTTLTFDRFTRLRGSALSVPELFGDRTTSSAENVLWLAGLVLTSLVASLVGGYAAVVAVRPRLRSVRSAHRALLPRLPALLLAWMLGHVWFVLAALVLANADAAALGSLIVPGGAALALVATLTACAAPAIVIERLGPLRGLRRSWQLARIGFGPLFGFVIVSAGIGMFVQYGIAYLPRLLDGMGLVRFGRFGWLVEGVAGQIGRLISMPLVAVATVMMYIDTRMSLEGMDIVMEADRAFGARP